jgi:FO synthase
MDESITRAAGAVPGQQLGAADMERLIHAAGRTPRQRTTLYGVAPPDRADPASRAATRPEHRPQAAE